MTDPADYPPPFESPNVKHLAPPRPGSLPAVGTDPYGDDSRDQPDRNAARTFRRPAHWPDLDAWRALTEEQRQERTRTMIAAAAPVLGVQPTADGRHLEITPTVRAQVSHGRLYVSTIQITDDPAAVDTARERLAAAGWTVHPLDRIAFEAEPPTANA